MELVSGFSNPPRLEAVNRLAMSQCESVEAAVAYVTDQRTLIDACRSNAVKLSLWVRYDHSMPVDQEVFRTFLNKRSPNFTIRIVPDIFHPKVIWWHGFGAYIGSANLTQRAWAGGIEAGLLLTDEEIVRHGLHDGLVDFFQQVDELSHPVTNEFVAHVEEMWRRNSALFHEEVLAERRVDEARKILGIPKLSSLFDITRKTRIDQRKNHFLQEWNSTLQVLRDIASRMNPFRPAWIREDAPAGAQADQFLHAYYYGQVQRSEKGFQGLFQENRGNPESALQAALDWWQAVDELPDEKQMLEERLPELQNLLAPDRVLSLNPEELGEVCVRVHALFSHARQVSYDVLDIPEPDQPMRAESRVREFGRWLHKQQAPNGRTPLDTIHYVLYGGREAEIPTRIFESTFNLSNKVPRLGVSSLGEIVGWVRPDFSPPRNNRTNKALRALGYDVKVYGSE